MRIHIRRTRMNSPPRPDGTIDVSYDVWVPADECPDDGMNRITIIAADNAGTPYNERKRYHNFPQATWRTELEPGYERYDRWLQHEKTARRRMLAMLHEHCPETRHLTKYPVLWANVDPDTILDRIEFDINDPLLDPDAKPAERPNRTRVDSRRKDDPRYDEERQ